MTKNPIDHYQESLNWLEKAVSAAAMSYDEATYCLLTAQVHATLALRGDKQESRLVPTITKKDLIRTPLGSMVVDNYGDIWTKIVIREQVLWCSGGVTFTSTQLVNLYDLRWYNNEL